MCTSTHITMPNLPNDIRWFQFADGEDILSNGSIVVILGIEVVTILCEDVN